MSFEVSHTNSRSMRIGDLGFSPMDRGKLDGSGSGLKLESVQNPISHGRVKVVKRATLCPYCMRLRRPPRVLTGRDLR